MNKLRLLRVSKNLKQSDLANILNISSVAYSYYENEKRDIPTTILKKLADYYDVSIDYILGNTDKSDLEKKLYNLDLTEEDFDNLISLAKNNKIPNIEVLFSKEQDKLTQACKICSLLDWDYTIPYEDLSIEQEEELISLQKKNRNAIINAILNLDKNKIIHNHIKNKTIDLTGLDTDEVEKVQEYADLIKYKKNSNEKSS